MEDFNYKLAHIPNACNRADALSRRPDHDDGSNDNDQVVALLDNMFIKAISMAMLDEKLRKRQKNCQPQLEGWKGKYHLRKEDDGTWYKDQALVVVGGEDTCKELLETYHNALTAGHLGVLKTLRAMCKDYWWPGIRQFV